MLIFLGRNLKFHRLLLLVFFALTLFDSRQLALCRRVVSSSDEDWDASLTDDERLSNENDDASIVDEPEEEFLPDIICAQGGICKCQSNEVDCKRVFLKSNNAPLDTAYLTVKSGLKDFKAEVVDLSHNRISVLRRVLCAF